MRVSYFVLRVHMRSNYVLMSPPSRASSAGQSMLDCQRREAGQSIKAPRTPDTVHWAIDCEDTVHCDWGLLCATVLDCTRLGQDWTVYWAMHRGATGLDWAVLYTYWPRLGCTVQLPWSPRRVNSLHQDRGELALSFRFRMLGPLVVAASTLKAPADIGEDCARLYATVPDCARLASTGLDCASTGRPLAGHWASYWGRTVCLLASTVLHWPRL
jgi:hypothetical protein